MKIRGCTDHQGFNMRSAGLAALGALVLSTGLLLSPQVRAAEAEESKGVGPVKSLTLEKLSDAMAKEGKGIFDGKCSACHKMTERYVGPGLADVTKRRSPEWIMNMILNPAEMLQKDSAAQELLGEYMTQMTFQNVSEADARKILEYFRYYAAKGELKVPAKTTKKK